jgi:hypothetical protein
MFVSVLLKILKFIFKGIGWFFLGLLMIFLFNYLVAERYIFPEPKPFSGASWYNPYSGMDSTQWRRTNLHMHSHAWGGLTNGSNNSNHKVWDLYRKMGYESIGISNYQYIDTLYAHQPYYIPVYEHGYGIFKNHQLSIGARKVIWYDLPFGQNLHHKQYVLNRLKKHTELLSINHPAFFKGYKAEDFKYLGNYDLIEALNGYRNSIPHWDSALSAGKPAFLMANDDMHDLSDPGEMARRTIVVNAPDNHRENILASLQSGKSYGVEIKLPMDETYESKMARFDTLPALISHAIINDTLKFTLSSRFSEVRFYGQHGKLLHRVGKSTHAEYVLQPNDTYVRAEVLYPTPNDMEGIVLFLNPVIRSTDGTQPAMSQAILDVRGTWVYRIIGFASVFFILANIIILRKRFRKKRK